VAWNRVVRGTHWAVAIMVLFNLCNEEGAQWHRWAGYTVVALVLLLFWCVLLALGLSGWMMQQDAWWGETWLEDCHEALATALWGLVPVHVAGALLES
jgi:cytochrome b